MLTAGIVIRTLPGSAEDVANRLAVVPGVRMRIVREDCLTGVCSVPLGQTLPAVLAQLSTETPSIVEIQTMFVAR